MGADMSLHPPNNLADWHHTGQLRIASTPLASFSYPLANISLARLRRAVAWCLHPSHGYSGKARFH